MVRSWRSSVAMPSPSFSKSDCVSLAVCRSAFHQLSGARVGEVDFELVLVQPGQCRCGGTRCDGQLPDDLVLPLVDVLHGDVDAPCVVGWPAGALQSEPDAAVRPTAVHQVAEVRCLVAQLIEVEGRAGRRTDARLQEERCPDKCTLSGIVSSEHHGDRSQLHFLWLRKTSVVFDGKADQRYEPTLVRISMTCK